jgi:CubicO group peptidase (beta-lactamase class C family)
MCHTAGILGDPKLKRYSLEEEVKEFARRPLAWDPGTKYHYSPGPEIAGRVIEVVSNVPYCQFIQERLLDPLEMRDTTFWPNAEQAARLALTHKLNPETKTLEPVRHVPEIVGNPAKCGPVPPTIISQFGVSMIPAYEHHFARPSGSLFSTAPDLAKFCQMLLGDGEFQGKRYLSPAAIRQMTAIHSADLMVGNGAQGYGIGCFVQKKAVDGEPSPGSFGHHGSHKTQMWIDPPRQIAMILLVQCAELNNHQQHDLYSAYQRQAIARFGKARESKASAN